MIPRPLHRSILPLLLPVGLAIAPATVQAQTPDVAPDRSSPRRAVDHFLGLYAAERFEDAAGSLNLEAMGVARRRKAGPDLARRLGFVLSQRMLFDPEELPVVPTVEDGARPAVREIICRIALGEGEVPITMERRRRGGQTTWRFDPATVRLIPALYRAHGPGTLGQLLPEEYSRQSLLGLEVWQWIGLPLAFLLTGLFSFVFIRIGEAITRRAVEKTSIEWDNRLFRVVRLPMRTLSSLAVLLVLLRLLRLPGFWGGAIDSALKVGLVMAGAWLLLRTANFLLYTLQHQLLRGITDDRRARGVRTQIVVLRRVAFFLVVLIGLALALTQFKAVRTLGVSLLASAGLAGVILSFAAQKSLSSLLAGIQLALTQPLRIDDKILIHGEVGTVEEINLTFLVIRVWDQRRLVVPISQVLDQPFQNWSLAETEQMGDVTLQVDPTAPIDRIRAETERLIQDNPNWNQNFWNFQVTDAGERTITVRALMTAHPDKLWDLRCEVREQLIAYLQRLDDGKYLPRLRIDQQ